MNNPVILVIDDELQIRRLLEISLTSNGYLTQEAATGKEGLILAASHPPDLVILDLGLPDQSGHEVLKKLREWFQNPVIILSVISQEEDIIRALDNGANDYLVKPFRTGELLARIRSVLRATATLNSNPLITCRDLVIDLSSRTVKKNNITVKFTATEFSLIALFAANEGKVLTHQYLLRQIWGPGFVNESQYLRVFIAQIRKKIENDPNKPEYLVTESRVGYRFVANE